MDVFLYARQSKGDASIAQQLELAAKRAAERGWNVVGMFSDESISATTGEPRPGYDAMMAAIKAMPPDVQKGIVVRHYDRLYRQPRELEGLIDDTEGVHVESYYGGGYDLGTADGRMQARVVGAFARGEAEKKAERQRLGAQRDAAAGKPRLGCPRPFGWTDDRVTRDPDESEAIREAARALLGGGTLAGVCRDWTARGVRPLQAGKRRNSRGTWTRASVKTIMCSPRLAGIATYRGEELSAPGQWEPILTEEQYRAVKSVLTHPSRQRTRGVRTMLGGLAGCRCGNTVVASLNQLKQPIYRCNPATRAAPGPHVAIRREPVDAYIELLVLSHAEAAGLSASPDDGPDVVALRDEAQAIRANLDEMAADRALGLVTRSQMIAATERGNRRLAEIEAELDRAGQEDAFALLVAAENARESWDRLTADRRRAIVAGLFDVTLHPAGRGKKISADPMNLTEMHRLVTTERR